MTRATWPWTIPGKHYIISLRCEKFTELREKETVVETGDPTSERGSLARRTTRTMTRTDNKSCKKTY